MTSESRNGWLQWVGIIVVVLVASISGTAWIVNAVNATTSAALEAIAAQASLAAKTNADFDRRLATVEVQIIEIRRISDQNSATSQDLRNVQGNLVSALQHLTDIIPSTMRKGNRY